MVPAPASADQTSKEFLSFTLGSEEYGIDLLLAQELRWYEPVTRIANSPDFVKGVLNLRGVIVPVVDMRLKFNLEAEYNPLTVVVVLKIRQHTIGMVVDGVADVISLTPDQIRAAPEISSAINSDFILGLGSIEGEKRMLILLDIEKLMASDGMGFVSKSAELVS